MDKQTAVSTGSPSANKAVSTGYSSANKAVGTTRGQWAPQRIRGAAYHIAFGRLVISQITENVQYFVLMILFSENSFFERIV